MKKTFVFAFIIWCLVAEAQVMKNSRLGQCSSPAKIRREFPLVQHTIEGKGALELYCLSRSHFYNERK